MPEQIDLTITSNGMFVCKIKGVNVVKTLPEKDIYLIQTSDGATKWLKTGQTSIEFSKLTLNPRKELFWDIKKEMFFKCAKSQIEQYKTEEDERMKSKLLNMAQQNYESYIHISKKIESLIDTPETFSEWFKTL